MEKVNSAALGATVGIMVVPMVMGDSDKPEEQVAEPVSSETQDLPATGQTTDLTQP
ncbi:hypothetical protein IWQ61_010325, partial [Dispira simplex]